MENISQKIDFTMRSVASTIGWKGVLFLILFILMALDYLSGTLAAKRLGLWKSSVSTDGLFHKLGKVFVIIAAVAADFVLARICPNIPLIGSTPWPGVIMPLVAFGYIVGEIGSILENAYKMGAGVPEWFIKAVRNVESTVNKAGEKAVSLTKKNEAAAANMDKGDKEDH